MGITDPKEALTHIETARKDLAAFLLSFPGAYGLFLTYRRVQTTEQGHITDRYSKAIEQLGAMKETDKGKVPNIEVRLGAIYALERIAWDSPRDHWTIMEVLTAYIRENAPAPTEPTESDHLRKPPIEIQAILDVITRRNFEADGEHNRLNLASTDLRGAELSGAPLNNAVLTKANLQRAKLSHAKLQLAPLYYAQLQGAILNNAQMDCARLQDAELKGAYLHSARLREANLQNAKLQGAVAIEVEQIKSAEYWQYAHYDPKFRRQLGLPDEPEPLYFTQEPT